MKKNKCNVVMLATENETKLFTRNDKPSILMYNVSVGIIKTCDTHKGYHLYITSNDEIKEDEWCLIDNNVGQSTGFQVLKCEKIESDGWYYFQDFKTGRCSKIIATTNPELHKDGVDKIDLDFIEEYITEYNKGMMIKEVNVEISEHYKLPVTRADGTIIIHKVQEVFTKEDMEKAFNNGAWSETPSNDFETWFEQNY